MPRMVANPTPGTRLRGTDLSKMADRHARGPGLRSDAMKSLHRASTTIRLRGTALKPRPERR
ncbi:MAG: hypothetical protein VX726_13790 [Planctomycetota bacterium]|nr:hypothetical protein [Planctomycetota bacterium]